MKQPVLLLLNLISATTKAHTRWGSSISRGVWSWMAVDELLRSDWFSSRCQREKLFVPVVCADVCCGLVEGWGKTPVARWFFVGLICLWGEGEGSEQ